MKSRRSEQSGPRTPMRGPVAANGFEAVAAMFRAPSDEVKFPCPVHTGREISDHAGRSPRGRQGELNACPHLRPASAGLFNDPCKLANPDPARRPR